MSEWAQMLSDFMVNPNQDNASYSGNTMNYCLSAAIGGKDFSQGKAAPAGTTWWGAACGPTDGDTGIDSDAAWSKVYKADGPQPIMQDDGSEKETQIVEFNTVLSSITHDLDKSGPLPLGIWIGGVKHSMIRKEIEAGQNNELNFVSIIAARKGEAGHVIICTDADAKEKCCIVTAEFDKPKGCPSSMAKTVALDFAKWLKESGTDKSDAITG